MEKCHNNMDCNMIIWQSFIWEFKGFEMLFADPLKESAVWLEEVDPEELRARSGSTRPVSPQINTSQDPLGTGADVFG